MIRGMNLRHQGSMNDINILDCSSNVERITKRELLFQFEHIVNRKKGIFATFLLVVFTLSGQYLLTQ